MGWALAVLGVYLVLHFVVARLIGRDYRRKK